MYNLLSLATFAFVLASSVSSVVIPRVTPPADWQTDILEDYDTYHERYLDLDCQNQHNSSFFDLCCHPLLATESLADRPAQCDPNSHDEEDCDEDEHTTVAPASTQPHTTIVHTTTPVATTPKPAPPPTSKASEPKTTAQPQPKPVPTPPTTQVDTSLISGGFATYYYQNGNAGACGDFNPDSALIAAIDVARYGNTRVKSSLCGRKVEIINPENQHSVVVTIADACPTCNNGNSIDLSVAAFQKLAPLEKGLINIKWKFV